MLSQLLYLYHLCMRSRLMNWIVLISGLSLLSELRLLSFSSSEFALIIGRQYPTSLFPCRCPNTVLDPKHCVGKELSELDR